MPEYNSPENGRRSFSFLRLKSLTARGMNREFEMYGKFYGHLSDKFTREDC